MKGLNLILFALLLACALGTVAAQHQARKLFVELQRQQALANQMDVEWGQLQLEQSTWAMHSRIEKIATGRLHMQVPDPLKTRVVTLPSTVQQP
ncbi:MAG: cell division protein FtsL [Burkholderiales bacterium]